MERSPSVVDLEIVYAPVRVHSSRIAVPTYLLLSTLSPQGLQTLQATPERVFEVNREFEASDVKVLQQWALLGPYDMLSVVTAPGMEAIAKISAEMAARGSARVDTLTVIEVEDLLAGFEQEPAEV